VFEVTFTGLSAAIDDEREVSFPFTGDTLRFMPSGQTVDFVDVPLDSYADEATPMGIPLGNGVIDLGTTWLLADPASVAVAPRLDGSGTVRFRDSTAARDDVEVWRFFFGDDEADARALVDTKVNHPVIEVAAREEVLIRDDCADCSGSPVCGFALLPLVTRRRR
jgi:hypothetical protein